MSYSKWITDECIAYAHASSPKHPTPHWSLLQSVRLLWSHRTSHFSINFIFKIYLHFCGSCYSNTYKAELSYPTQKGKTIMINNTKKRKQLCPHIWGHYLITHAWIYVNGANGHVLWILERPRKVKFMSRGKGNVHKKGQDS